MAYLLADGPQDIDARHAWAPAAGTAPPVINTRTDPPTPPWIKLLEIPGFRDHPEIVDNREGLTFGEGEADYPSRTLGKTVVYVCEARALTRESLAGVMTAVIAGFGRSRDALGTMTVTPNPAIGGPVWTFTGRVIALTPDPAFSWFPRRRLPFRRGFTVSIRMSDPYFYSGETATL